MTETEVKVTPVSCKGEAVSPSTEGLSPRLKALKSHYLTIKPSISIARAKVFTEVYKENAGTPPILLRAMAFRRACEEAPCIIQDNELIVGCPCGAPRAGAFSPDIAWRWLKDEIDTVSTRAQDPYQLAEEDKKVLLEEIFPYWEGRSQDEICERQYRLAGVWELSNDSVASDLSYHQVNGGGDTAPGYDITRTSPRHTTTRRSWSPSRVS